MPWLKFYVRDWNCKDCDFNEWIIDKGYFCTQHNEYIEEEIIHNDMVAPWCELEEVKEDGRT